MPVMTIELKAGETLDDLLHGELKLIQQRDGYRYSADALLIASFALPLIDGQTVLDMGTGAGTIALILAARGRPARVIGVEILFILDLDLRNDEGKCKVCFFCLDFFVEMVVL